ncbi:purine and uridine phosphorylase [Aspergillus eucalypticola CBS 122712]|uniref:Purine and uridine phosphorylase n=1 Tax=Aspergillus eucalypticola (strain CBS 122712 / IBT 29274) TaxID=1448314 RepID=A0A317VVC6_ASPEC|nr:purine and uridine phosphorylase [Aspergillus eucalypticola CBS 122712]PWY77559.1 purine and uridine phosphorylase [Aspergillus eucalypticola CBS 122712]
MPSTSIRRLNNDAYTVALICPLEVELKHGMLLGNRKDPNIYILGSLNGHNVVLAALPKGSQGTASAAAVAIHLIRTFPAIKLRLLAGIGGGIPSLANDIRLGDVVVSAPDRLIGGVVEYDLGKETTNGFKRKGVLCPPPAEWRKTMANMTSDHQIRANRIASFLSGMLRRYPILTEYQRPLPDTDLLFPADYIHAQEGQNCVSCDATRALRRAPRTLPHESRVFYGIIASGNRVIKDGTKRDIIARESGGAMCCEMEAAGLMDQFQCVVIPAALAKEALMYMDPHCIGSSNTTSSKVGEKIMGRAFSGFQPILAVENPSWPDIY